jgi:hypothetical protein
MRNKAAVEIPNRPMHTVFREQSASKRSFTGRVGEIRGGNEPPPWEKYEATELLPGV